jgi:lipopolysaccharide/colanic/teichoic acid biosynthesis glycosyltransferase
VHPSKTLSAQRLVLANKLSANDAVSGITGNSQVNGKNKTTFRQMPEMDTYYSRNASLWLDVMILLGPIPAIMGPVIGSRILCGPKEDLSKPGSAGRA